MPVLRSYGLRRDRHDPRDRLFMPPPGLLSAPLPPAADVRRCCPPVMDQGELGACVEHGTTGALRYLLISAGRPDVPLSRLQLYYDVRKREGTIDDDAGGEIRDAIKCVATAGVAPERDWPYDVKKFKLPPPPACYVDPLRLRAISYERVAVSVLEVKSALAAGFPVVIGLDLYESFESDAVARTGVVPMPGRSEQMVGGHCMYAVGYGQRPHTFTVRNSWNTDWGDSGDCYFPEAYIGSGTYGSDYWVIKSES